MDEEEEEEGEGEEEREEPRRLRRGGDSATAPCRVKMTISRL